LNIPTRATPNSLQNPAKDQVQLSVHPNAVLHWLDLSHHQPFSATYVPSVLAEILPSQASHNAQLVLSNVKHMHMMYHANYQETSACNVIE
jgi:hypothetical protein